MNQKIGNSEENKDNDFFTRVLEVVAQIPHGKITTYGAIAEYLGLKGSARMVGWALNSAAGRIDLPCHRVVNRMGELSGKMHFATPTLMRELLEAEGIIFIGDAADLSRHMWYPGKE